METPVSYCGEGIPRWCKSNIGNVFANSIGRHSAIGSRTTPHFSGLGDCGVGHQRCLSASTTTRGSLGYYFIVDEECLQLATSVKVLSGD